MSTKNKIEEDVPSTWKMASYGFTFLIETVLLISYNLVVFYYYEVEVGLATVLVGLSFVIFAIWNMVNDPLLGYLTDKPLKWANKYGVRRPWIFIGGIGLAISFFLLFLPPDIDVKSNPWPIFWYMIIITCLFDTFYTIFTTHYFGGFGTMFREESIRRKSSVIIRFFGNAGVIVAGAILVPFIIRYGDRASFVRFGLVILIVVVICVFLALPGIKENDTVIARYMEGFEERKKLNFWNVLKAGFKSKNFVIFLYALTMATIASNLFQVNSIFFIRYVLREDVQVMTYVMLAYLIGGYIGIPLWFKLSKKYGTEKVWQYGLLAFGLIFLVGLIVTTLLQMILWFLFVGFFFASYLSMLVAVMSDAYDEVTLECGCHQEATLFGINNFFARFSYFILAVIITGVHISTGFVPEAEIQTPSAIWGIRLIGSVFPAIFLVSAFILVTLWYDLKGEKKEALKAALKERGL